MNSDNNVVVKWVLEFLDNDAMLWQLPLLHYAATVLVALLIDKACRSCCLIISTYGCVAQLASKHFFAAALC